MHNLITGCLLYSLNNTDSIQSNKRKLNRSLHDGKNNLILLLLAIALMCCERKEFELKDIDGNRYRTGTYDGTLWMLENLKVTRDKDGKEIHYYYPNNDEELKNEYGLLYDFEVACKVCPSGWRLPSNEDWTRLEKSLAEGGLSKSYKEIGFWDGEDEGNSSGFSVRPSGYGNNGEHPNNFDENSYIWSASGTTEFRWAVIFEKENREVRKAEQHPIYAFAVRCIKS